MGRAVTMSDAADGWDATVDAHHRPPHSSSARRLASHGSGRAQPSPVGTASGRSTGRSPVATHRSNASSAASLRRRQVQEEATPHLFEFSLGVFEERPKQSPRDQPRSSMWDAVKRVTGLYMDVYRQL